MRRGSPQSRPGTRPKSEGECRRRDHWFESTVLVAGILKKLQNYPRG